MAGFPGTLTLLTTEGWEWPADQGPNSFPGVLTPKTTEGWEFSGFVTPFTNISISVSDQAIIAGESVTVSGQCTKDTIGGTEPDTFTDYDIVQMRGTEEFDRTATTTDGHGDYSDQVTILKAGGIGVTTKRAAARPTITFTEGWE